jgi:hypothetical protein
METIQLKLNFSSMKLLPCRQKYIYTVRDGLKPKGYGVSVDARKLGKAIHLIAEMCAKLCRQGKDEQVIILEVFKAVGSKYPELLADKDSKAKIMGAVASFNYPYSKAVIRHELYLEYKAAECVRKFKGADTKFEIYFCGTLDAVALPYPNCVEIRDYKSTSNNYKSAIADRYRRNAQLQYYMILLHMNIQEHPELWPEINVNQGFTVKGTICPVFMGKPEQGVSWDTLPSEEPKGEFVDGLPTIVEWALESYCAEDGVEFTETGRFLGMCPGCEFESLCWCESPAVRNAIKSNSYIIKPFNPSKHED